jgi:hypothetical protein
MFDSHNTNTQHHSMVLDVGTMTKLTTSKCYLKENFVVEKEFNFAFHFSISHSVQKKGINNKRMTHFGIKCENATKKKQNKKNKKVLT